MKHALKDLVDSYFALKLKKVTLQLGMVGG